MQYLSPCLALNTVPLIHCLAFLLWQQGPYALYVVMLSLQCEIKLPFPSGQYPTVCYRIIKKFTPKLLLQTV